MSITPCLLMAIVRISGNLGSVVCCKRKEKEKEETESEEKVRYFHLMSTSHLHFEEGGTESRPF